MLDYEDHEVTNNPKSVENSIHEAADIGIAAKQTNNFSSNLSRCHPKNLFQTKRQALECAVFSVMVLSLFLAIIVPMIVYSFVDNQINSQVVVDSPNAPSYDTWQTNANNDDVTINYDLYYFDLQNEDAVLQGAQPIVTEVGPYAFREYYNKFDISWTDDGDTVTYNTQRYYVFDPENTDPGLSLSDKITLPYPSVIGFEYLISTIPEFATQAVDVLVDQKIHAKYDAIEKNLTQYYIDAGNNTPEKNLIIALNNTINSIFKRIFVFENYSQPADLVLKLLLCNISSGMSPFWQTDPVSAWFGWLNDPLLLEVQKVIDQLQIPVAWTSAVPGASVNWTSEADTRRRRAPDTMKTGKKNKKQVAETVLYTNMDSYWTCINPMAKQNTSLYVEGSEFPACPLFQPSWSPTEAKDNGYVQPFDTDYANRVEGSNADMFGRPVTSEKLQVFVSDIYRSCYLLHTDNVEWNGVNLRRYELQDKDLANATVNPNNEQYYSFGHNGVENATKAANIPVFISFPHFYGADKELVAAVKGLKPKKEEHFTYLDIEPQTGLLARASKKLQINYLMESKTLPQASPDAVVFANSVCANITSIIIKINKYRPKNKKIPLPSCNLTSLETLLTCAKTPSKWTFQNDKVYFPYGWANEAVVLPDSDADDLKNSLYAADDFADGFQFWCVLIAVVSLVVLVVLQAEDALHQLSGLRISGWSQSMSSFGSGNNNPNPNLLNNHSSKSNKGWGTEPLLSPTTTPFNNNNSINQGQQPQWTSPLGPSQKSGFSFSS